MPAARDGIPAPGMPFLPPRPPGPGSHVPRRPGKRLAYPRRAGPGGAVARADRPAAAKYPPLLRSFIRTMSHPVTSSMPEAAVTSPAHRFPFLAWTMLLLGSLLPDILFYQLTGA